MTYVSEHADALADVANAGASITFTFSSPGTQAADGTFSGASDTAVAGYATEDGGDPKEYERLGLTQHEAPRLFFVASTLGDVPALGAACSWGGASHTVRSVKPYRPDGTALFSYVIVAR